MMGTLYIITPSFNAAATIAETIRSVVSQPSSCRIRYHVQDGASSDGTVTILEATAQRLASSPDQFGHLVFSWDSRPDKGMYHAIATAVETLNIPPEAFMGWINADDLLCPDAVNTMQEIERNLPDVDWIGGSPLTIDTDGHLFAQGRKYSLYAHALLLHGLCDGLHWKFLQQEGSFWRKKIWDAAGGLDTRLRFAGDWDLWRRMARHAEYAQLPKPTGAFRRRPGQLSAGDSYNNELDSILPKNERRKALRRLLPGFSSMWVGNITRNQDGTMTRQKDRLRLAWKDVVQICLAVLGLYRLLQWSLRLNNVLSRIVFPKFLPRF